MPLIMKLFYKEFANLLFDPFFVLSHKKVWCGIEFFWRTGFHLLLTSLVEANLTMWQCFCLAKYSFLLKIYTKVAVAKIGYCGIIQGRLTWICFSSTRFQWIFLEQLPKSTYLLVLLIYIWCIYLLKVWHFSCWIRNLI